MVRTVTPEQKNKWMMNYEGQLLTVAAQSGDEYAIEHAKALVDGTMNGMIRIAGPEKSALFAFALSDRVSWGTRDWTVLPIIDADKIGQITRVDAPPKTFAPVKVEAPSEVAGLTSVAEPPFTALEPSLVVPATGLSAPAPETKEIPMWYGYVVFGAILSAGAAFGAAATWFAR